jgi:hypothetical protein
LQARPLFADIGLQTYASVGLAAGAGLVPTSLKPCVIANRFVADVRIVGSAINWALIASCLGTVVPCFGATVVRTRLPVIGTRLSVIWAWLPVVRTGLSGPVLHWFVLAGARVGPARDRFVTTIAAPRLQLAGPLFKPLRFSPLPFGLSQALLSFPLALGSAQFRLRALAPCRGSPLIGCCLCSRRLSAKSLRFLPSVASLDLPTLVGLSPHPRQNQRRHDCRHHDDDDDHDEPSFHRTPP